MAPNRLAKPYEALASRWGERVRMDDSGNRRHQSKRGIPGAPGEENRPFSHAASSDRHDETLV